MGGGGGCFAGRIDDSRETWVSLVSVVACPTSLVTSTWQTNWNGIKKILFLF